MDHDITLLPALALVLAGTAFLYLVYRALLPRPIPGIAHHKSSANSLFGDIPSMIRYTTSTNEVISWFADQCVALQSPIIQLFIRPLGRPMVFIADWRESQDILMRRTREFDRSDFFGEVLLGLLPKAFISMQTNDTFRHQRRLLANTMSPAFLNQVAAPRVYGAALDLVELWRLKTRLARNHPFHAPPDIHHMTLDAIWAATFGETVGTTKTQVNLLSSLDKLEIASSNEDKAAEFPKAPVPPEFEAIVVMTDSLDNAIGSPLPAWHHWFIRQTASYRDAKRLKDRTFDDYFKNARRSFSDDPDDQKDVRSAVENVLQREAIAARKQGRTPQFDSPIAKDELFGFLVAGHETTSTTVTWGVKYLADNTKVQRNLRACLRAEFASTATSNTNPSAENIVKSTIPYLDAVIEEILRCSVTSHGAIRNTKVDAEVLGYHIPKGTDVYMLSNGPDFMSPGFEIEESHRHYQSQGHKDKIGGKWDTTNMNSFDPERWLRYDEKGVKEFDPKAGPQLAFGQGTRGCFGKRLAYIELRMMIVLIVWNFDLKKTPPELSGYASVDKLTHRPQRCFVRLAFAEDEPANIS